MMNFVLEDEHNPALSPLAASLADAALFHGGAQRATARDRLPASLGDVALVHIGDVCAAVRMSASWVYQEVRARRFPQPMRWPRCTRWRAADIRAYLIKRAEMAEVDPQVAERAIAKAKKASAAAQTKRAATTAVPGL